jgi:hypothetical protein
LWNLQGMYSLVLEANEDVPYKIGEQGLPECHVLFVSSLIDFIHFIIHNNTISLFQLLFILQHPMTLCWEDPHPL